MVVKKVEDLSKVPGEFAITMGNFDGVHLGHRKILSALVSEAKKSGLKSLVITFTNHPKELIRGEKVIPIITADEKLDIIDGAGVDLVLALEFNEKVRNMSQREFLAYLSVPIKKIIVGHDFKFGYDAQDYSGSSIEKILVEPYHLDGKIVSSTSIREFMTQGEMEKLRSFLGRPYRHSGLVIHGKKIGKSLGYPTTNVTINDSVFALRTGVYITRTYLVDQVFESVTNIGKIPTFDGRPFSVETHILDFDRNIYGQEVKIDFLHYLRDEIRYDNLEDLKLQIKRDVEDTLLYFKNNPQERL